MPTGSELELLHASVLCGLAARRGADAHRVHLFFCALHDLWFRRGIAAM